jgi:hypothetical protein
LAFLHGVFLHPWDLKMSTKTCSNNMVSPNDHVVMNHQNQTPNNWHVRPCSLHSKALVGLLPSCATCWTSHRAAQAEPRRLSDTKCRPPDLALSFLVASYLVASLRPDRKREKGESTNKTGARQQSHGLMVEISPSFYIVVLIKM